MKTTLFILMFSLLFTVQIYSQEMPEPPEVNERVRVFQEVFEMSEREEKEYLKSMSSNLRADLEEIKKFDKEKYYDLLREAHFTRFNFPFMDKDEKERMTLEKNIMENEISTEVLGVKYQKANDSEKQKIKTELMKKLSELFDYREKQRKIEVEILTKEIEELRNKLAIRKKNKDAILFKRFNELTGADKYMDWD